MQSVWVHFACIKRLFILLKEVIIMSSSRSHVSEAQYSPQTTRKNIYLKIKRYQGVYIFWRDREINWRCSWICVLSIMPQWKVCLPFVDSISSFYDCKKCTACCRALDIPFTEQKLSIIFFGGIGTHWSARKMRRDYEQTISILQKFFRQ